MARGLEDRAGTLDAHDLVPGRMQHQQGTVEMGDPVPLVLGAQVLDEGPPDDEGLPAQSNTRLAFVEGASARSVPDYTLR
jgi:hypothetical protein